MASQQRSDPATTSATPDQKLESSFASIQKVAKTQEKTGVKKEAAARTAMFPRDMPSVQAAYAMPTAMPPNSTLTMPCVVLAAATGSDPILLCGGPSSYVLQCDRPADAPDLEKDLQNVLTRAKIREAQLRAEIELQRMEYDMFWMIHPGFYYGPMPMPQPAPETAETSHAPSITC